MANSTTLSDADILEHVVSPVKGGMDPDAARAILDLKFDKDATKRIRLLLQKNNRGTISAEDRITLEKILARRQSHRLAPGEGPRFPQGSRAFELSHGEISARRSASGICL